MIEPQIRPAVEGDVADIHRLLLEAEGWLAGRGMPMWLPDELAVDPIRREVQAGMFHLAEVNGDVAGVVRFQLEDDLFWPDLPPAESAFVHRLAVRRSFAGQGVGAALLRWAAGEAGRLGRSWLRLDCDASRPALRRFYEQAGFRYHSDRQVGPHHVARYELRLG